MTRTVTPSSDRTPCGRRGNWIVRSLSICCALDRAHLVEFGRITNSVQVAPNDTFFTEGQIANSVFGLTAGVARLYKTLPDGRRQIVGFALPGDFLGTVLSGRYAFSADAIRSVSLCHLTREAFTQFIAQRPHESYCADVPRWLPRLTPRAVQSI